MDYILSGIQFVPAVFKYCWKWWTFNRPAGKVLEGFVDNEKISKIFVKDLMVPDNTSENPKLISREGSILHANPNILKVWPDVEAKGTARLLNLFGRLGKKDKLEIVEMSEGYNSWDCNLIVLGAQSGKSGEFYNIMENVGYKMDGHNIYESETERVIKREDGYGYGLILKTKNNQLAENQKGIGILLGGFGVLGTEAAIHYFCNNIGILGKEFGNKSFSVVVRARIASGAQSVERVEQIVYND